MPEAAAAAQAGATGARLANPASASKIGKLAADFSVFNHGRFCCDQAACMNGGSTFLFQGKLEAALCMAQCAKNELCSYATVDTNSNWCMNAQNCKTTGLYSGGVGNIAGVVTFQKKSAAVPSSV